MSQKRCNGKTKDGADCKAFAGASGFCFTHDVEKGAERAIARRNGGLATKSPHYADASMLPHKIAKIDDVLQILDYALREAVGLDNSINRGRLLVSIAHGFIEALKVGELETRIESIEHALRLRKEKK